MEYVRRYIHWVCKYYENRSQWMLLYSVDYLQLGASSSCVPIREYFCTFGLERGFFVCLQAIAIPQNMADKSNKDTITPTKTYRTDQSENK